AEPDDVAVVVDVHGRHAEVVDLEPIHGARPLHHGDLRARVVEGVEGIGRTVDRDRREVRARQAIEVAHGGAVRPAGHVDPVRVALAARYLTGADAVDRRRMHFLLGTAGIYVS